jgi:hypothetical protein
MLRFALSIGVIAALTPLPAFAANPACQPVLDAIIKQAATPNRLIMKQVGGSTDGRQSMVITTGDAMYVQVAGKWHKSAYDPKERAAEIKEKADSPERSCTLVKSDPVDGTAAKLYRVTDKTDDDVTEASLWIATATGLPLRQSVELDVGGKDGESRWDARFEYDDVTPPPE